MQDIVFAKALYDTLDDDDSFVEVHTSSGVVQVKPRKLSLPGEGSTAVKRWRQTLGDSNPNRIGASGSECAVIEGFAVDLTDRQVPFELRVSLTVNPEDIKAVVRRWLA